MYAKILPPCSLTSFNFSRLFYLDHIQSTLGDVRRDVWEYHKLLENIESGDVIVFGLYSKENNSFLGSIYGTLDDGVFTAHLLLKRKVDVVKAANECTLLMKKCCSEIGEKFIKVQGFIPDCNRAAKRLAVRAGYTDCGIDETQKFCNNGEQFAVRHFVKEII